MQINPASSSFTALPSTGTAAAVGAELAAPAEPAAPGAPQDALFTKASGLDAAPAALDLNSVEVPKLILVDNTGQGTTNTGTRGGRPSPPPPPPPIST
ncbi:MAG: hypothetical protein JWM80_1155 [Cyanobacteria bacterium RYN_339]|nr:hypothetical protein [Cyanobacteria bacterium RYN_339]